MTVEQQMETILVIGSERSCISVCSRVFPVPGPDSPPQSSVVCFAAWTNTDANLRNFTLDRRAFPPARSKHGQAVLKVSNDRPTLPVQEDFSK
ncbi:hypothetical protein J6590_068308 [Homalodisca vitripennis]|nr:hypothetical protein J6590_068308 [Homalodisca vitripennis]